MALVVFAVVAFSAGVAHAEPFVWSRAIALDTGGVLAPVAVSCPSATQCTAIDTIGREVTFAPASGATTSVPRIVDDGSRPQALACPSVTECIAVDSDGREVTFDPTSSSPNATPS